MFRRQSFSLLFSARQALVAPIVVSRTFQSLTSSSTARTIALANKNVSLTPAQFASRKYATSHQYTKDQVRDSIMNICREFDKINASKLTIESHFMNDLGLDSLDHVEVIMAVEDEFGFEIPDVEAEKLHRPADIVAHVCAKLSL